MRCNNGKRQYSSEIVAEEALIEAHVQFDYRMGHGPIAVYHCEECGLFHLTSKGIMNARLAELLKNGKINKQKRANDWERKWK